MCRDYRTSLQHLTNSVVHIADHALVASSALQRQLRIDLRAPQSEWASPESFHLFRSSQRSSRSFAGRSHEDGRTVRTTSRHCLARRRLTLFRETDRLAESLPKLLRNPPDAEQFRARNIDHKRRRRRATEGL